MDIFRICSVYDEEQGQKAQKIYRRLLDESDHRLNQRIRRGQRPVKVNYEGRCGAL